MFRRVRKEDDLELLKAERDRRRPRVQRRAHPARSRHTAASGRVSRNRRRRSTNIRSRRSTRSGRSTRRRPAAACAAASRRPSAAPSRRLFEQQQAFNSAVVDHINRNVPIARQTRESIDDDAGGAARSDRRARRVREPAGDVPAADHAVRGHARSQRRRAAARVVRSDQRGRRRSDEADRSARSRASGGTKCATADLEASVAALQQQMAALRKPIAAGTRCIRQRRSTHT